MSDGKPERITDLDCMTKAEECRHLSRLALSKEHRVMLVHMADTWERIADDIGRRAARAYPRLV
jgi:hypothetical protein